MLQNSSLNPVEAAGRHADRPRPPSSTSALKFWGNPTLSPGTTYQLNRFAALALKDGKADWQQKTYPVLVENALRQLIGVSPDMQTS